MSRSPTRVPDRAVAEVVDGAVRLPMWAEVVGAWPTWRPSCAVLHCPVDGAVYEPVHMALYGVVLREIHRDL